MFGNLGIFINRVTFFVGEYAMSDVLFLRRSFSG